MLDKKKVGSNPSSLEGYSVNPRLSNTVVSTAYTHNGKKLRNSFIREFPADSIGKCNRAGICYNHHGNFSQ